MVTILDETIYNFFIFIFRWLRFLLFNSKSFNSEHINSWVFYAPISLFIHFDSNSVYNT